MKNFQVAETFRNIAKILEIKGDNPFRIRAYERAALNIENLSVDIEDLVKDDNLKSIPGIGEDLNNKIKEIVNTGKLKFYEDLKKSFPSGLMEILAIPSVGPKTAKLFYEKLKIKDVLSLERSAKKGKLIGLPGVKEKTVQNILEGIELVKKGRERMNLAEALRIAQEFVDALKKLPEVKKISTAGSLRRMKETVRDIDILVTSSDPKKIMDAFVKFPLVKNILAHGETKSSIISKENIQVDLRVVEPKSFGAALVYFTGSKSFNIKLRQLALKRKLKINEYGIFDKKEKWLAGISEEEMFKFLKLEYIVPELREDRGEIELAKLNQLPELLQFQDIRGDFHVHSEWSDGTNSIEEIAEIAHSRGYEYVVSCDHSQSLKVANGLSPAELKKKKLEIDKVNKKYKNFRVLFGTEVDIDSSGNLDYKDEILANFDIVVAAIHSGFKQSKDQLTRRIIKACSNKYVNIIAHPTGVLWGTRAAYDLDFDKIFKVAKETNTFLEINCFPNRLDLNDINAHHAKESGVKLAIGTDSHIIDQLDFMKLGVAVARRGWLGKKDVINTLSLRELLKAIKK
ncbi:MAG: DNA polymerase/3'-5' exonuclease PolX [Candidatus Omnitrophota bacterium]